jgi:hypothetical protein
MRLPRIRFTVRQIMIVVAIAAVALGANDLRLRWNRYHALRSEHEWKSRSCLSLAERHAATAALNEREAQRLRAAILSGQYPVRSAAEGVGQIASNTAAAAAIERSAEEKLRARARFHDALRLKYERAARYPWLAVGPDPPEPE